MDVAVVGAGVSGLSCAFRIAAAGHKVCVIAKQVSPNTTSDIAAAMWWPFHAEPPELINKWSAISLAKFVELANLNTSGVVMRESLFCFASDTPPSWIDLLDTATPLAPADLTPTSHSGVRVQAPMIEMNRYMPWLTKAVEASGVQIETRAINDFNHVEADLIVNTTGLGARILTSDDTIYPVRGCVVVMEQCGIETVSGDDSGEWPTHVFPRQNDVIVGGTYEPGIESSEVPASVVDDIMRRATAMEPLVAHAKRIELRAGFRPARPTVRLERTMTENGTPVIHNYGHGGAGVTLSWGCAESVINLI